MIDVPNDGRERSSSCGSAGTLEKAMSGFSPMPETRMMALSPCVSPAATMWKIGSGGLSPRKRMTPRCSSNRRPANS